MQNGDVFLNAARMEGAFESGASGANAAVPHDWKVVRVLEGHAHAAAVVRSLQIRKQVSCYSFCNIDSIQHKT